MAVYGLHPAACERAREWASLRLDGELSEFEQVLLRAHLTTCVSCSAHVERVEHATESLREAPLVALGARVALPARRRRHALAMVSQVAGAAAVLATAVGLGSMVGAPNAHPPSAGVRQPAVAAEAVAEDVLIREPRLAMINAEKGLGLQRGIGIDI